MTKKRFNLIRTTIDIGGECGIQDNTNGYVYIVSQNLVDLLNDYETKLKPIQDICHKYQIPIKDLPEVLEEYITLDNEEYEEKLKERTI